MTAVTVRDDADNQRYVLEVDGRRTGLLDYRIAGDRIRLTHAEIDPTMERQGLGSQLAAFALDDARRRSLEVVPLCPFVKYYIRAHREYLDLVPESERERLGL
jgi:predicted GNAT family acetyltransferase